VNLPPIIVNRHASERALDRHPVTFSVLDDDPARRDLICREVREAIRAGRRSELHPGFSDLRTKRGQTFAWTAQGERVYVLHTDGERIFVTTTLAGFSAEWAA
jgi:hypothetical protein